MTLKIVAAPGTKTQVLIEKTDAEMNITEYRPRSVERGEDSTIAVIKNGSVYIEQWQDRDHFPDIAEGSVFPVWVRVERINERV